MANEEFELKFLEVDVAELENKLLKIGARKVGEYDYSRVLMDYPGFPMNKEGAFVRLRSDGKETTLTYKKSIKEKPGDLGSKSIGMNEIETRVDDYGKAFELLKSIGLIVKREEKNRRVRYQKGEVVFDIDFWPFIPTYLEIESDSYDKVRDAARELGLDPEKGIIGTAGTVYKEYGYDILDYTFINFEKMEKR